MVIRKTLVLLLMALATPGMSFSAARERSDVRAAAAAQCKRPAEDAKPYKRGSRIILYRAIRREEGEESIRVYWTCVRSSGKIRLVWDKNSTQPVIGSPTIDRIFVRFTVWDCQRGLQVTYRFNARSGERRWIRHRKDTCGAFP